MTFKRKDLEDFCRPVENQIVAYCENYNKGNLLYVCPRTCQYARDELAKKDNGRGGKGLYYIAKYFWGDERDD